MHPQDGVLARQGDVEELFPVLGSRRREGVEHFDEAFLEEPSMSLNGSYLPMSFTGTGDSLRAVPVQPSDEEVGAHHSGRIVEDLVRCPKDADPEPEVEVSRLGTSLSLLRLSFTPVARPEPKRNRDMVCGSI